MTIVPVGGVASSGGVSVLSLGSVSVLSSGEGSVLSSADGSVLSSESFSPGMVEVVSVFQFM